MGLFDKKEEKPKADFSNVGKGDKARADFSNVQSGSSTTAREAETPASAASTYTVKKGDTLSAIAKQQYGDGGQWRRIFEANRDQIDNPDLIHPGQELKIPARTEKGGMQ